MQKLENLGCGLLKGFFVLMVSCVVLVLIMDKLGITDRMAAKNQAANEPYVKACRAVMEPWSDDAIPFGVSKGKAVLVAGSPDIEWGPTIIIWENSDDGPGPYRGWRGGPRKGQEAACLACLRSVLVTAGRYSDGGPAQRCDLEVWVLDWPEGTLLAKFYFAGKDPPAKVNRQVGYRAYAPIKDVEAWLLAQQRR